MNSKIVKCIDCGKEFPRKDLNRKLRCYDCGMKAMFDAIHQLSDKSGPYYDKWVKSQKQIPDNIEQQADKMRARWIKGKKWRASEL